jgi:hypothetical protein
VTNIYRLTVDASDVGVGAVLFQDGKDNIDLPNCYFSLKFENDQKKVIHNFGIE